MEKKIGILFVSSGNKQDGISAVVKTQGESLKRQHINLDYFPLRGKGFAGYGRNIRQLSKTIRKENYSVIHAHYSLSGFTATMATPFKNRIVVSLMGTFRKGTFKYFLIRFLAKYRWETVIVKSERMKSQIGLKNAHVIPNGVFLEKFTGQACSEDLRKAMGLKPEKKYILFISDPRRPEKNFSLCQKAFASLNNPDVELLVLSDRPHDEVVQYMLAADVLMLTSFTEGSPNVIKEAMAANCPIVTTNVGDVVHIIGNTDGCFILNSFDVKDAGDKLQRALAFGKRTNGRERIISLGLDDESIAKQIIDIYYK